MKLSFETAARIYAAGRNYISAAIMFGGSIGILSAGQQKSLTDGFSDVYAGIAQIAHGGAQISQVLVVVAAPATVLLMGWYAQRSAKGVTNAAAIGASPSTEVEAQANGTAVVTIKDPAMAAAAIAAQDKAA